MGSSIHAVSCEPWANHRGGNESRNPGREMDDVPTCVVICTVLGK